MQKSDALRIIEKYYHPASKLYELLILHSTQVTEMAIKIAVDKPTLNVDIKFIEAAGMIHDIGIYLCNAPDIYCMGTHRYIEHGYLGADIVRKEGYPKHALICERHTGIGLSREQIIQANLPVPHKDMRPTSIEEILLCYADKFYSKSTPNQIKSVEQITQELQRFGYDHVYIFNTWHNLFKES